MKLPRLNNSALFMLCVTTLIVVLATVGWNASEIAAVLLLLGGQSQLKGPEAEPRKRPRKGLDP
ncbi:MAG: hypothetical protein JWO67_7080 [Streptosporangiaceae bacterium]|nr:hypothetical protein [Streptosporangiaceae bacterium]